MTLCRCGCGKETNIMPFNNKKYKTIKGESYRYISGHNNKIPQDVLLKRRLDKIKLRTGWIEGQVCKCGCGIEVTPGRQYRSGHDGRGKKYGPATEEHKIKLSLAYIGHLSNKKGKKFEDIYGIDRANKIKNKLSKINKGKTYEEIHGIEKAKKIKQKLSNKLKGRISPMKGKISSRKGKPGIICTEQTKEKLRIKRAKQINVYDSKIEKKIRGFLEELNIKYEKHFYITNIEHKYQCDIFVPVYNLVIECDGIFWHNYPYGNQIDHIRTNELLEHEYKILRLWEIDINKMTINDFDNIIKKYKLVYECIL